MLAIIEKLLDKNFTAENKFLRNVELKNSTHNRRTCLTDEKLKSIKDNHPKIPADYLSYLKHVGWGDFRECGYMIYSGLITLDSIGLKEAYPIKENMAFFGDDFSGDMAGFNLDNHYSVAVLWHESGNVHETGLSFRQFIRSKMGMGRFGKDMFK